MEKSWWANEWQVFHSFTRHDSTVMQLFTYNVLNELVVAVEWKHDDGILILAEEFSTAKFTGIQAFVIPSNALYLCNMAIPFFWTTLLQ